MDRKSRKPMIVGNWKMHGTVGESLRLLNAIEISSADMTTVDIVIAPPFTALYSVGVALSGTNIQLAAQNMFYEDEGAYTGEISGVFLRDVACKFVLIGHSERRKHFGDTDKIVGRKLVAAIRNDLMPILCVGENLAEREAGSTLEVIDGQLKVALQEVNLRDASSLTIAYEPVWAIGTGKTASPKQAEEVHNFIRRYLAKHFDAPLSEEVRILYGGSVNPDNAASLMLEKNIDGLLVGGASLDAKSFVKILKFEQRV